MLQEEEIQALRDSGLTYLQAKVYLVLLKTGNSTVKKVAEKANIARQEAQRVTAELQKMGLVEKVLANPTVLKPVPIKIAVSSLISQKEKEVKEFYKRTNTLLKKLNNTEKLSEDRTSQFIITSSKEAVIRKIRMIIDKTKESIDIINGFGENDPWARFIFEDQTNNALKRNVRIRIVTPKPYSEQSDLIDRIINENSRPNFITKITEVNMPAIMSIFDSKELIVNIIPEKRVGDTPILWTDNPALIMSVQTYFNKLWRQAQKPQTTKTKKQNNK
jgi:sugar-specific transcriptional regulator TrmB